MFISEQGIAKHARLATLGSCYHPFSWKSKGKSRGGDTRQKLLYERIQLASDWGTGWAQLEGAGGSIHRGQPLERPEQHRKGEKNVLGWKESVRKEAKTSIIITEHYKENLNRETNHSSLIPHSKEVSSLKECPVFIGISIKTDIIYIMMMMNICQAMCQALGQGFTSIASPKPHTALWNRYSYHPFLINGEPKAKRGNSWRSYSHARVQQNLRHLSQSLYSWWLYLTAFSTSHPRVTAFALKKSCFNPYLTLYGIRIFLILGHSSCFQLFHYYKCCCHEHLCI